MNKDIQAYHKALSEEDKAIADLLYETISTVLPEAENKIWHRHPVWFLEGNPIVGYSKLKDSVRLLFWSGQSFEEPKLLPEGTFKAAEARYKTVKDVSTTNLKRWLKKSKTIQWDYKNLVKRKGKLEWLELEQPAKKVAAKKGKLAEIKTKATNASVEDFINSIDNETKRKDSFTILEMMKKATKDEPKMWGGSIIGFGDVRYESPTTGRQVDWFKIGFSPRKANLSLYLTTNIKDRTAELEKLGKYKTGGGCLYINKLADVDTKVLKGMIDKAVKGKY
jgi:uncharacterized protein YdhG (YjbR/CyaY superfamily)